MENIVSAFGGYAGIGAAIAFIIKYVLDKRTRNALAEVSELTADELRVKMADNITKNLQAQLDSTRKDLNQARLDIVQLKELVEDLTIKLKAKTTQLFLVEEEQDLARRKIFLLEKAVLDNGMELPYEVFNES